MNSVLPLLKYLWVSSHYSLSWCFPWASGVKLSKISNTKKSEEESLPTKHKLLSTTLAVSYTKQRNFSVNRGQSWQTGREADSNYKSMGSCQEPQISSGIYFAAMWLEPCVLTQDAVRHEELPAEGMEWLLQICEIYPWNKQLEKMIKVSLSFVVHSGCWNKFYLFYPPESWIKQGEWYCRKGRKCLENAPFRGSEMAAGDVRRHRNQVSGGWAPVGAPHW